MQTDAGTTFNPPAFQNAGFTMNPDVHSESHQGTNTGYNVPNPSYPFQQMAANGYGGGYRDFGKGKGYGNYGGYGKGKGKGGKGKGRGGKNNYRSQVSSIPLFEEGTKVEEITATSFEELGVHPRLCEFLARNGFTAPFPIQSLCVPEALAGKDVCGKAKTGSGKTLAFGLPLLQMLQPTREKGYPSALILVPTRELALQVHQVLSPIRGSLNIEVAYGGSENRKFQVNTLLRKPVDILVACPGRLIDFCESGLVSLSKITHLVLDEADRMAEMGFQEQVDDILRRIGDDRPRQTMLFSATLDSSVDVMVKRHMNEPVHHQVAEKSVTVDQMTHRFIQVVHSREKMAVCAALCCLPGLEKVLVFVRTKLGVDDLTAALKHNYRIRALAIHGDKTQTARERTLQAFDKGDLHVLVATDVAARGLDIRRVDFVINYDSPEGVDGHKIYLHRSGRTARAGKTGLVATLATRGDQEHDVEIIKRRLNVREPTLRVGVKDAANLPQVLNLEQFLEDFNEGRRLDPRIEASRQRILREIEEGGATHTPAIGMGTYNVDTAHPGGKGQGKGGKGKGMNAYGGFMNQQFSANGSNEAQPNFGGGYAPNGMPDYNQQQVTVASSLPNTGALMQPSSGAPNDQYTMTNVMGKGAFSKGGGQPRQAFGMPSAGRGQSQGMPAAVPSFGATELPAVSGAASNFRNPYGNSFAGMMQLQGASGDNPNTFNAQAVQVAPTVSNPYAWDTSASDTTYGGNFSAGMSYTAPQQQFGAMAMPAFATNPNPGIFNTMSAPAFAANGLPTYAPGFASSAYGPAIGASFTPSNTAYQGANVSTEGTGY